MRIFPSASKKCGLRMKLDMQASSICRPRIRSDANKNSKSKPSQSKNQENTSYCLVNKKYSRVVCHDESICEVLRCVANATVCVQLCSSSEQSSWYLLPTRNVWLDSVSSVLAWDCVIWRVPIGSVLPVWSWPAIQRPDALRAL